MNKHDGKYRLQYAAPGTHYDTYGDGVYESASPLGPFTYAENNPFSFKPTGFMTGAGHSCTFPDVQGNLWHIATGVISVRHIFERRLGLYPVGFDTAGRMFCDTKKRALPQFIPGKAPARNVGNLAGWMVLSYGKKASASSSLPTESDAVAFTESIRDLVCRSFPSIRRTGPSTKASEVIGAPPRAKPANGCKSTSVRSNRFIPSRSTSPSTTSRSGAVPRHWRNITKSSARRGAANGVSSWTKATTSWIGRTITWSLITPSPSDTCASPIRRTIRGNSPSGNSASSVMPAEKNPAAGRCLS